MIDLFPIRKSIYQRGRSSVSARPLSGLIKSDGYKPGIRIIFRPCLRSRLAENDCNSRKTFLNRVRLPSRLLLRQADPFRTAMIATTINSSASVKLYLDEVYEKTQIASTRKTGGSGCGL